MPTMTEFVCHLCGHSHDKRDELLAVPNVCGWCGEPGVYDTPHPSDDHEDTGPDQSDVDQLRELLDLMGGFSSNDQRARYLLSSNWLRDYRLWKQSL